MTTNHDEERGCDESARAMPRGKDALIVITGFMGTGKTSVGRLVADEMGCAFVDMDSILQAREGKTIREIFATRGEAYFRSCENDLSVELDQRKDLVIATGGETLLDLGNRACFRQAFVVCLDAKIDALLRRLKNAADRPLLQGDTVHELVTGLFSTRRASYAEIEVHVGTTGKTVEQVAAEIVALFRAGRNGEGRGAD